MVILNLGHALQIYPVTKILFLTSFQNLKMMLFWPNHLGEIGIVGLTGSQSSWLKTSQCFPIQSSVVEQEACASRLASG